MLRSLLAFVVLSSLVPRPARAESKPSPRWLEAGLRLRVVDTLAFLDSVGSLELEPALAFPARRLEARSGPPIACLSTGRTPPLDSGESLLSWGPDGSVLFRADRRKVRLDPATGTLSFGKLVAVVPPQDLSHLPSSTSRPRLPVAASWSGGRWLRAPSVGAGAGALTVPVQVGGLLASLRIDRAEWRRDGWDLGSGIHLLEWLDEPVAGRTDTLEGSLRLELASPGSDPGDEPADSLEPGPSRIVGYGGMGLGRRDPDESLREIRRLSRLISMGREARGLVLAGKARWAAGPGPVRSPFRRNPSPVPSARFEDGRLRADSARLPSGARVVDAFLDPAGGPVRGTLLDTEDVRLGGGVLAFGPGTRLVRGLPALGGPGTRRLVLDLADDTRLARDSDSSSRIEVSLVGASTASRTARSSRPLRYRDGRLSVGGLVAVERRERDDREGRARPDEFVLVLDSFTVDLPGMTDTLGRPAESVLGVLGSQELRPDREGSSTWQGWGPWSQWVDESRPWLVWRFRPGLARQDRRYLLRTDSLRVAWVGSAFRSTWTSGSEGTQPYVFGLEGFGCDPQRTCAPVSLPIAPATVQGSPWPGLGRFVLDSTIELLDTTISVRARLIPSPSWTERLGKGPLNVDLATRPIRGAQDSWRLSLESAPALNVHFAAPPLSGARSRFLLPEDTLLLASPRGALRFARRWDDPILRGPVILGFPEASPGIAVLREATWTGDDRGALDLARERWETLARPTELVLRDGSRLRALEPLQVFPLRDGRSVGAEVKGRLLARVEDATAHPVARDSVVALDAAERLLEKPARRTIAAPEAFGRAGRVQVAFADGTFLKVDRIEVTRGRWDSCVAAGACPVVSEESCRPVTGFDGSRDQDFARRVRAWRRLPDMPMTCLGASQARLFCRWTKGRLPRRAEVLRIDSVATVATRGSDTRWPVNSLWNFDRWQSGGSDPYPDLSPAGNLRALPPGLFDLFGNVEEWCESESGDRDRDGRSACAETDPRDEARPAFRRESTLGFRCVED